MSIKQKIFVAAVTLGLISLMIYFAPLMWGWKVTTCSIIGGIVSLLAIITFAVSRLNEEKLETFFMKRAPENVSVIIGIVVLTLNATGIINIQALFS